MKILAHRGIWGMESEKNSLNALDRALGCGYGIETDIRDYLGELVISHDIATKESFRVEDFFGLYQKRGSSVPLALNVKADGIQKLLGDLLKKYNISNYFVFDMSVPEMVVYKRETMAYYTRHSDIENQCVLYRDALGVWIDSFYCEKWLKEEVIEGHIINGKKVCVVSPEIHGYDENNMWSMLNHCEHKNDIMLCTDKPREAEEYFSEKNKGNSV